MAPRPNWKGYLKLSLVSCAVALFPATTTRERVRFNIINRKTGDRVRYQVVDAETGKEVPQEDRLKGYKVGGEYVLLEEEELDNAALESTHTIDIGSFVAREEVDELYLDEPYFLVPDGKAAYEAFAVIREAMRHEGLVGIGRVVLYRRERLLMLAPSDKGIVGTTLRYANEVREAADYFDDIPDVKIDRDTLDLAKHILETKRARFDPSKFKDRYETALKELIAAKRAGRAPRATPPPPTNVVNLMDALRRSVDAERRGTGKRTTHRRSAARGQRSGGRKKLKRAS